MPVQTMNHDARRAAKRALRAYGQMTAAFRGSPDFIIIGAKRGGTTSLYNYMLEHPSVSPLFPGRQHIKGIRYFDSQYSRGQGWYRSHFPLEAAGRLLARPWISAPVTGEASPYYLFHPLAAQRLAREAPKARIIVLLRDPVERAYSHYKERVRHDAEPLTFEEALEAEPGRLLGEAELIMRDPDYRSREHEDHSYLAQGRYLEMLPRWFELFPREQFHIVASEDFYTDPNRVVNDVWSFLGLPPAQLRSSKRHNYVPAADLRPATRDRLQAAFAEHNRELERLLGRSLPWSPETRPAKAVRPEPTGRPEWPTVTAIVATRDRPALLERAVRSILTQDYPGDVECVVVFDQSSPEAIPVEESPGRRLQLGVNTRTPGLAGARNTGILGSAGSLVAFCDDDDEWDPDKLRRQVELLKSSTAEFVACGVRIHYADHVTTRLPPPRVSLGQLARDRVTALHPSSFVVRRAALDGIGLVDEQIPGSYGEDYDWLLRAARRMPIAAVEQPLVNVYWHQKSFFAERWQTIADALAYLLDKHPELSADRHGLARIQGQIAFAQAALPRSPGARSESLRALRNNPLERRAYLALAVASGVVPAASVLRLANRLGRGI